MLDNGQQFHIPLIKRQIYIFSQSTYSITKVVNCPLRYIMLSKVIRTAELYFVQDFQFNCNFEQEAAYCESKRPGHNH